MRVLTQEHIQAALGRLTDGPRRYIWLQEQIARRNVTTDREFQTAFNGFYRVRRNLSWRSDYYQLMESSKESGIEFPQALREIARRTNRIEASFASKLVATIDPSKPVIDKFVLENFGLKLPRWDCRIDRPGQLMSTEPFVKRMKITSWVQLELSYGSSSIAPLQA
jgi:hypothetical protein